MADDEIQDEQEFTVPEMWELVKPTIPEDDDEEDVPSTKKARKAPPAPKIGKLVKMLNDIDEVEELEAKVQELDPATGQSLLLWATVNQKFVLVEWLVKKCQRAAFAFEQSSDNVLAIFDKWVEIRKELEEKEREKALNPPEEEEDADEDPEEKEPEPTAEQLVFEGLSEFHEDWGKRGLGLVKMVGELGIYQGARDANFSKEGVGRTLFPSGDMYCGEYKDNKRNGFGTYFWSSKGMLYTGRWRNNIREGVGRMIFPDGGRYLGSWSSNKRNGEGRFTYPDGSSYNGAWVDDLKNGFGTYTFVDGSQYIGSYVDGEFISGEWRMAGGATRYYGAFENDKPIGAGVYVFKYRKEGSYRQVGSYTKSGVWQPAGPVLGIKTEPSLRLTLQGKEHALKFTDECGGYTMEQLVAASNFGPFIAWMRRINANGATFALESVFVSAVKFDSSDRSKVIEVRLRLVAKDADGARIRNTQAITLREAATRLLVVLSDGQKTVGLLVKSPNAALGSSESYALPTIRMGVDGIFHSEFTRLVQPVLRLDINKGTTTQILKPLLCAPQLDSREEDVRAYVQRIHPDAMTTLQERLDEASAGNTLFSIIGVRLGEIPVKTSDALTLLAARRVETLIANNKLSLATVEEQRPPTPLPPAAEPRPDIEPLLEEERMRMAKLAQAQEEEE